MIDVDTLVKATAVIGGVTTTVGVSVAVAWRFFAAFNSKTDKATTNRMFALVDEDRKDIAEVTKNVAVMGRDVQHLTTAIGTVGRNVEEILRNGKEAGGSHA